MKAYCDRCGKESVQPANVPFIFPKVPLETYGAGGLMVVLKDLCAPCRTHIAQAVRVALNPQLDLGR